MQTSANYGLKLMEGTDNVRRQDFVDNFITIDTTMKTHETQLSDLTNDRIYYCGTTSGTNTYTAANSKITAYTDGLTVRMKIGTASTGASTLNINGLGAKTILDTLGNAITSGGLKAGLPYQLCYNGTNFIVLGKGGGGTATADKILSPYTATNDTGQVTGTIPSKTAVTYNPSTSAQTIASGQYLSGTQTINPVTGNSNTPQVLSGYTFASANGIGLTGTMPNHTGADSVANSIAGTGPGRIYVRPQYGYYDGSVASYVDDANFIAANIISGISIFGVAGSATIESLGGKKKFSGTATATTGTSISVALSFVPSTIIVSTDYSSYKFIYNSDFGLNMRLSSSVTSGSYFSISGTTFTLSNIGGVNGTICNWVAYE